MQGVLATRVLELLWGMIMAPDAHADVVAAAIKGLRDALYSYDASLDDSKVQPPYLMPYMARVRGACESCVGILLAGASHMAVCSHMPCPEGLSSSSPCLPRLCCSSLSCTLEGF